MIKTIVFDMGGVIFEISRLNAVKCYEEVGFLTAKDWLNDYEQKGIFGLLESGKISEEEYRKELSLLAGKEMTWADCQYGLAGYFTGQPKEIMPELKRLHNEGYRLLLLSNTNSFMMDWVKRQDFDGEGHSIVDYLDNLYLSYEVGLMKPNPEIFQYLLDKEQIKPEETLFIDDGPCNVTAAKSLGLHTLCPKNASYWIEPLHKMLQELNTK